MKFRITPRKLGQVVTNFEDTQNRAYILVELASNDGEAAVVDLNDLQRNAHDTSKVSRVIHDIEKLTVIAETLENYIDSWNYPNPAPSNLKVYFIENLEDVRQYFRDLHEIYDSEFYPDDNFEDFTDEGGEATFTREQAEYLNKIMIQCFDVCDKNDVEIYDIAGEVQEEVWRRNGLWPKP